MEILPGVLWPRTKLQWKLLATLPELQPMPPAASASNVVAPEETRSADSHSIVPADPFVPDSFGADPLSANPVQNELAIADPLTPPDELQPYPWGSAKKAHEWLETVKTHRSPRAEWLAQQWQRRRANIYLVMAGVILLLVISGWGIRPAGTKAAGNATPTQTAPQQQQAPAQPQLTLFEKLMINLGLAEPPPAPVDLGNPNAQVWVDVHTWALGFPRSTRGWRRLCQSKIDHQLLEQS